MENTKEKLYFGSPSLHNTAIKVKAAFPECSLSFKENGDEKYVSFRFSSENRRKYSLSEGVRRYQFVNDHLILGNGKIDPFKYDALDEVIEQAELDFDVEKRRRFNENTEEAIASCQKFHDTAVISIGNAISNTDFDIKLTLNDVERCYHLSESGEVHLYKKDPDTVLRNEKKYRLSGLPSGIQYKILKTTHPGLKTSATEYISGIRDDKKDWSSPMDAYMKSWKKEAYDQFGITAFDVLADVPENRLVGKFADTPMRRLVLIDGSEYAYCADPLTLMPYSDYVRERNEILSQYKSDVMDVCKETGVIPQAAIEELNVYAGKSGPVIFCDPKEAVLSIRKKSLAQPLNDVIKKINRTIKLHNYEAGFLASARKSKPKDKFIKLDLNEDGDITKVDINMLTFEISKPYKVNADFQKNYIDDFSRYPMTEAFLETLNDELQKSKDSPEYLTYKYGILLSDIGFVAADITEDGDYAVQIYRFPDYKDYLWINPYTKEIGVSNVEKIRADGEKNAMLEQACDIFSDVFLT